ncbi:MAG: 4Fe-4S dicluster domain-containing protein [Candidatus Bathyarchaeia archaeon]
MMVRWAMVIDISKCIACYACFNACKDEFWGNDYPPYSASIKKRGQTFIRLVKRERGKFPYVKVAYMPILCMQCDKPKCMEVTKNNSVYKREDGIVIIDPVKAIGQKEIVDACPYNSISWNEEKNLPQKCTFCVHRIEVGRIPKCVEVCPSGAMSFGDLDDEKSAVSKKVKEGVAEQFHPEYNTKPKVFYINLHKMTKYFIAGSVVFGDTDECAEGVEVSIINLKTNESKTAFTDFFGNFEFDGLEPNTEYLVKLTYPGYQAREIWIKLEEKDVYLGNILLERD